MALTAISSFSSQLLFTTIQQGTLLAKHSSYHLWVLAPQVLKYTTISPLIYTAHLARETYLWMRPFIRAQEESYYLPTRLIGAEVKRLWGDVWGVPTAASTLLRAAYVIRFLEQTQKVSKAFGGSKQSKYHLRRRYTRPITKLEKNSRLPRMLFIYKHCGSKQKQISQIVQKLLKLAYEVFLWCNVVLDLRKAYVMDENTLDEAKEELLFNVTYVLKNAYEHHQKYAQMLRNNKSFLSRSFFYLGIQTDLDTLATQMELPERMQEQTTRIVKQLRFPSFSQGYQFLAQAIERNFNAIKYFLSVEAQDARKNTYHHSPRET